MLLALTLVLPALAQRRRAAEIDRGGVPEWAQDAEVPRDVFQFARIRYTSHNRGRRWREDSWYTDAPDAELNLAFRLHEMTSLRVHDDTTFLDIDDPRLFDFPFLYIVEPGYMDLSEEEAGTLRKHLLGGGFLMLDDFWGEREGENAAEQIRKIFPDRELQELEIEHPVFHTVFNLKEKPQVPSIHAWWSSGGLSYERQDASEVHYRAVFDDKGRMMVMFCHNTDNGDGWEREGESKEYFLLFAEKQAYPLMINILFYAMTH